MWFVLFVQVACLRVAVLCNSCLISQVFEVIRRQALQELLEEGGSISSLWEYYSNHNQITSGQSDLPDVTDDGNMLKVTSSHFLHSSVPSTLNGIVTDPMDNTKDVEQLEKHCRDLKSQLELVKIEIVKIISEKKACSKENCALKIHISVLKNRLRVDEVLKDISCLHLSQADPRLDKCQEISSVVKVAGDASECTRCDNSGDAVNESVSEKLVTLEVSVLKGSEVGIVEGDRAVPSLVQSNTKHTEELVTYQENDNNEKEKFDLPEKSSEQSSGVKYSASSLVPQIDDLSKTLKKEEERHVKEVTGLRERCCELENSLELLRQVGLLNMFPIPQHMLHCHLGQCTVKFLPHICGTFYEGGKRMPYVETMSFHPPM
jgi:hypothetical protein